MDIAKRSITTRYRNPGVGNPLNEVQREEYMRDCPQTVLDELAELLEGFDDHQKLSLIYRMLTTGVTYDKSHGHKGVYSVLQSRRGVCDDISRALVVLAGYCCHDSAIFRIIGWPRGSSVGHAWNVVNLSTPQGSGVWFLDPTKDLGGHWDYFLIGAKKLDAEGGRWNGTRFPEIADADSSFKPYRNPNKERELADWFLGLESRLDKYVDPLFKKTRVNPHWG